MPPTSECYRVVGMALAVVASCILALLPVTAIDTYPTLSPSVGKDPSTSLFPQSLAATTFCPAEETVPCVPVVQTASCLDAQALKLAFSRSPSTFESLVARQDVTLVIESQAEPSSLLLSEIMRILLTEVQGYSMRIVQNAEFHNQLPRCVDGKYDMHPQIWRTDWTDEEWLSTFSGDATSVCELIGASGLIGRNAWYADTASIQTQAMDKSPLDFWKAYRSVEGVVGLPPFTLNLTTSTEAPWVGGLFFVPPQCNYTGAQCGVAYCRNSAWEPGVAQQQVVNLALKIVLFFPPNPEVTFFQLVEDRLQQGKQVFALYYAPDPFSASPRLTRVALPDPSEDCYKAVEGDATQVQEAAVELGQGNVRCDFRSQNLQKIARISTDSDYIDAHLLFTRLLIDHETILSLLSLMFSGESMPDVACTWLQQNTQTWTSWIPSQPTPRRRILKLDAQTVNVFYAILALFLVVSIASVIFLWWFRTNPLVRRSSVAFNQVMIIGTVGWYAAMFVGMQDPSLSSCIVSQFLISLAFSAFYGSLAIKTWRIYKIYSSSQLRVVKLPNQRLALYLLAYAAVDLAIVILWSAISPPSPTLVDSNSSAYAQVVECSSPDSSAFRAVLYILRGIFLAIGAALAVRIRNVEANLNESKFLLVMTYNIIVVASIILGIGFVASNDPKIVYSSYLAGVAFAVFGSLLIFILPKSFALYSIRGTNTVLAVDDTHTQGGGLKSSTPKNDGTPKDAKLSKVSSSGGELQRRAGRESGGWVNSALRYQDSVVRTPKDSVGDGDGMSSFVGTRHHTMHHEGGVGAAESTILRAISSPMEVEGGEEIRNLQFPSPILAERSLVQSPPAQHRTTGATSPTAASAVSPSESGEAAGAIRPTTDSPSPSNVQQKQSEE